MRFSLIVAIALVNFAAATYIPRAEADLEFVTDPAEASTEFLVARHDRQHNGGLCHYDSSDCCGFNTGFCVGPVVALIKDGGCGHGESHPEHKL